MKSNYLNTKNILLLLIAVVSILIVVSLAVAVSVVHSQMQTDSPTTIELTADPIHTLDSENEKEALILERMQLMHEEGNASTTSEELERMKQMNERVPDLSETDQEALLERMRTMRNK